MSKKQKIIRKKKEEETDLEEDEKAASNYLTKHVYLKEIIEIDSKDPKRYICNLCSRNQPTKSGKPGEVIGGYLYWLKKHLETKMHQGFTPINEKAKLEEAISSLGYQKSLEKLQSNEENVALEEVKDENEEDSYPLSKKTEAKLYFDIAYFIVSNNLPYVCSPLLLDFCKYLINTYDKQLIERSHISATTTTKIIDHCIAGCLRENSLKNLEETPFSLLLDASSDVYGGKYLGVLVRYIDFEEEKVSVKLLSVLEINSITTGETFHDMLNHHLLSQNEKIKNNLIGISTDNGRNMISSTGLAVNPNGAGVINRLSKEIPSLIFVRDMCHIFNLIVEEATKQFPAYILQFLRGLCSYFNSGLRSNKLKEAQAKAGVKEPLEMLTFVDTRWESLLQCIERTLKLWKYLEICLAEEDSSLKEDIEDPEYQLYLYLLYVLLHKLTGYIIYFQKPNLLFDKVVDKIIEGYILFMRMILKPAYQGIGFEDAFKISLDNPMDAFAKEKLSNKQEFACLFLDRYPRISELIKNVKDKNPKKKDIQNQCFDHVLEFIKKTLLAMKRKLPYNEDIVIKNLAVYLKDVYSIEVWRDFAKKLPNMINDELEIAFLDEVDSFSLSYEKIVKEHRESGMTIIKRWKLLRGDYPLLFKIASALLTTPYSTSTVESLFSEFKAIKTAYRNRLNVENLEASILSDQYFRSQSPRILPGMMNKYFEMWGKKEKKQPVTLKVNVEKSSHEEGKSENAFEIGNNEIKCESKFDNFMSYMHSMYMKFNQQVMFPQPEGPNLSITHSQPNEFDSQSYKNKRKAVDSIALDTLKDFKETKDQLNSQGSQEKIIYKSTISASKKEKESSDDEEENYL